MAYDFSEDSKYINRPATGKNRASSSNYESIEAYLSKLRKDRQSGTSQYVASYMDSIGQRQNLTGYSHKQSNQGSNDFGTEEQSPFSRDQLEQYRQKLSTGKLSKGSETVLTHDTYRVYSEILDKVPTSNSMGAGLSYDPDSSMLTE